MPQTPVLSFELNLSANSTPITAGGTSERNRFEMTEFGVIGHSSTKAPPESASPHGAICGAVKRTCFRIQISYGICLRLISPGKTPGDKKHIVLTGSVDYMF